MASLSPFDSVPTGSRKFAGSGRALGGPSEPVVVHSKRGRPKAVPAPLPVADDGWSTCPDCQRTWLVLAHDDVHLPSCGCYGDDWHEGNRHRPCTSCGEKHQRGCLLTPPEDDEPDEWPQWSAGPEHIHGRGLTHE